MNIDFHLRGGTMMRMPLGDGDGEVRNFVEYILTSISNGTPIACKGMDGHVHAFLRPEDISTFQLVPQTGPNEMELLMKRRILAELKHFENLSKRSDGEDWKNG